jgi:hypothetical protein
MKMKKYFLLLTILLTVLACNNKNASSGESNETSDAKEATSEVSSEMVEEKNPDNFKIVAKYSDDNMSELNRVTYDYTIEIICKDDGSAQVSTKVVSTDEEIQERNKFLREKEEAVTETKNEYEGSWKTISVKRGTKYLTSYDIEASDFEFYFTNKFDFLFGPKSAKFGRIKVIEPIDGAYHKFSEGKTSYAWKITSFESL